MERLVYEQKSHLHYLIFNVSIPGITGLKRHQKKMGRLKTRQGDAHNISPYGFSPKPAQRRKPQASPVKEGGSPEPQASPAPPAQRWGLHVAVGGCKTTRPDASGTDADSLQTPVPRPPARPHAPGGRSRTRSSASEETARMPPPGV